MDQHSTPDHPALATHRDPSVDRARGALRRPRAEYGIEWVSLSELGTRASTRVLAYGARANRAAVQRVRTGIADRVRRLPPLNAFGRTAKRSGPEATRTL